MQSKKNLSWMMKFAGGLAAGMTAGAGLGYLIGRTIKHSHSHPNPNDIAAIALSAFYLGSAVLLLWIASDRMRLARTLEGKTATTPADDSEVRSFYYQAIVIVLAGILLAIPVVGSRWAGADILHGRLVFAAIATLFAAQTFYNVRLWHISDEFLRSTMAATAGLTFAIGQGALFLFSAAERIGLVKPVSAWELTIDMMILYMLVGSAVSIRSARRF